MRVGTSVQETEKPEGDFVAVAGFDTVRGDEAVGDVLDLRKAFAGTADLEEPAAVHREVAARRVGDDVSRRTQLVQEKGLPLAAGIDIPDEGVHQVRVVEEDFLRARKVLQGGFSRGEQLQEAGPRQRAEDFQPLVAVGFEFAVELGHLRGLGDALGEDDEHLLGLHRRRDGDVVDGRVVDFEDLVHDFAEADVEFGGSLLVERVAPVLEVAREMFENPRLADDSGRHRTVSVQERFQRHGGGFQHVLELQVFAERENGQGVRHPPTGQVAAPGFQAQHRRTGVDDVQRGIGVVEVLDDGLPVLQVVDLVEKQVGSAVLPVPVGQIRDVVRGEPDVVEGNVERPVAVGGKRLPDVLQHQCRLARSLRSPDADQPVFPVDFRMQAPPERRGDRLHQPSRCLVNPLYVFLFHCGFAQCLKTASLSRKQCFKTLFKQPRECLASRSIECPRPGGSREG